MFEADVTDVNGVGAIGGLGLEPAGGAIPLTGTNNPLTGGMSPEVLMVPTLGAESYDNFIIGPESLATGPPIEANDPTIAETISEAVEVAIAHLNKFAADPNFEAKMDAAFGDNWDQETVENLKEDWMEGQINLPPVEVISSGKIDGASGAFAGATNTIYLSRELLLENVDTPDAVADVLLEEFGHYVDARINVVDAVGDEGDIFSAVVQGKELSESYLAAVRSEDDTAVVTIDGEEVAIEMKQKWNYWAYKNWQDDWGNKKKADWKGKASFSINGYVKDWGENIGDYFLLEGTTTEKFRANKTYIFNLDAGDDEGIRIAVKAPGKKSKYQWITPVDDLGNGDWVQFGDGTSKQYAFTPTKTGRYSVQFQYFETEGDASVDISWEVAKKEPATDPGNSLKTAYNVGNLGSKTRRFEEFVGPGDEVDNYRFTLSDTSDVSLSLNDLNDYAYVNLIYDNGTVDGYTVNWNGTSSRATINETLGKGTYFVNVNTDGNTRYTLEMAAERSPSNTTRDPGNTLKGAYNVGNLGSRTRSFKEFVGVSDSEDNYRFTLSDTRDVSVSLNGLSEYAYVNLIYDDGTVDGYTVNWDGTSSQATINETLGRGTYFVNVNSDENTNYTLTLSAE